MTVSRFCQLRRAGKDSRMASLILLNKYEYSTNLYVDADAVKLAKRLDGFPLAPVTAKAYFKQAAISFSDYLRLYETL